MIVARELHRPRHAQGGDARGRRDDPHALLHASDRRGAASSGRSSCRWRRPSRSAARSRSPGSRRRSPETLTSRRRAASPMLSLVAIYGGTLLLTELISHSAAVSLLFPIALDTAAGLGVELHAVRRRGDRGRLARLRDAARLPDPHDGLRSGRLPLHATSCASASRWTSSAGRSRCSRSRWCSR